MPFFDGRIVFPYWSRGQVVFMIGRRTPWTPDVEWEKSKYKKLAVRNGRNNEQVAPCIRNDVLYNEDVLLTRPERVIITEGVTDCISLMEHGFPVVSPVTTRIRGADWERLLAKLRGVKTIFICQDNEISEVGLQGALETARILADHGIATRVAALPLGEKQRRAREKLARLAAGSSESDDLEADAKIDVNEFFAAGHTAADFEAILASAGTPLEFAISRLPADGPDVRRNQLLEPILADVAALSPLEQARHLKLIQKQCGKTALPMTALREQVRARQKERAHARKSAPRQERKGNAQPDSCRARIEDLVDEAAAAGEYPDFAHVAEVAFGWLADHGARFFRTPQGQPFLFFEDEILWMDSSDRGLRRLYLAKMYNQTGIVPTDTAGRTFYEVLANLAVERGEVRDQFSWIHTDIGRHTVYFNLNNESREIVRISPDSIDVLKNGGNVDGIILTPSNKMSPIHFLPDADPEETDRYLLDLIIQNMTCQPADRILVLSWLSCFLLIDFTGTRPMMRFEGATGSAKTTASKLITTVIYGSAQQKKSTDAANYTDGARNPLIALDNIEVKQLTEELVTFILTVVTGIAKEKRKSGTDTETVREHTNCLLNTTGIEPLGGELAEILSRTFIVRFDIAAGSDCFLEAKVLAGIREKRDLILSAMMKRTQHVLKLIRDGAQERVMKLLTVNLGDHNKRRCNDYLSLMYLMLLAGETPEVVQPSLEELNPKFLDSITSLNRTTLETARESNSIATALGGLFKAYRLAAEADRGSTAMNVVKSNKAAFLERYQLDFVDEHTIQGAYARDLYIALKRVAKEFSLAFPMNSVQQFAQRLANDLPTIREAGFEIRVNPLGDRYRTYDVIQAGA